MRGQGRLQHGQLQHKKTGIPRQPGVLIQETRLYEVTPAFLLDIRDNPGSIPADINPKADRQKKDDQLAVEPAAPFGKGDHDILSLSLDPETKYNQEDKEDVRNKGPDRLQK